jgi:DMSO/TMAO reductase YedYZ molybdopterin-dependent catalytic subunit
MFAFVVFLVVHVAMVASTGFARNMNHIVLGSDDTSLNGVYLGLVGVGVIVAVNASANWVAWSRPRLVQHVAKIIVTPVMSFLLNRAVPQAEFRRDDISPFLWANGKLPTCEEWKTLAANDFKEYRLTVTGAVENPAMLSLNDLRAMGTKTQITLHHCIQGWSGIAAWGGLPLAELVQLVRPKPDANVVVFHSFGDGVALNAGVVGVRYYDSLPIKNALHPQTLLAYEMNYQPLSQLHGAPLRLRVENQLGFKMVKWIQTIEFVEDAQSVGKGEGGFAEDHEYFGELANI